MIARIKPAVSKYWLLALAGSMWSAVGVMLCRQSYIWLIAIHGNSAIPLGFVGVLLALATYRFGFSDIAQKNINRICESSEKVCVFAFQAWKSYVIIGFMIMLGIVLRNSPIPTQYLSIVYTVIGGALLLSSFHYYVRLWRVLVQRRPSHTGYT